MLAFSKGNDWGWASVETIGCFVVGIVATVLFVMVERRAKAPLVNLALLRNTVLVGATLAILIVAGTINALMYVLSLYFQNPAGFGMNAFEAGLATLPAAAAMIAVTPLITPLAVRVGGGRAVAHRIPARGGRLRRRWRSSSRRGPTPRWSSRWSCSRSASGSPTGRRRQDRPPPCRADEVGQASGISNMARYIGAAVAVAIVATIFNAGIVNAQQDGASDADALAAGVSATPAC